MERLVLSCSEHSLALPCATAAFQVLQVYQCFSYDTLLSLRDDTGCSCNFLSVQDYSKFKDVLKPPLQPDDNNLFNVQGSFLHVLGTVVLPLSLANNLPSSKAKFFVTDFLLNSDGLLGLHSLVTHGIDGFLQHHAVPY